MEALGILITKKLGFFNYEQLLFQDFVTIRNLF